MVKTHVKSRKRWPSQAKGPLSLTETKDLEEKENEIWLFSTENKFASKLDSVINFVKDQGSFVLDKVEALDDTVSQNLYIDVGLMFLDAIEGIHKIHRTHCCERFAFLTSGSSKDPFF